MLAAAVTLAAMLATPLQSDLISNAGGVIVNATH